MMEQHTITLTHEYAEWRRAESELRDFILGSFGIESHLLAADKSVYSSMLSSGAQLHALYYGPSKTAPNTESERA